MAGRLSSSQKNKSIGTKNWGLRSSQTALDVLFADKNNKGSNTNASDMRSYFTSQTEPLNKTWKWPIAACRWSKPPYFTSDSFST